MKVRINVSGRLFGDDASRVFAGEEIELPDHQARDLVSRGEAVEVVVAESKAPEADDTVDADESVAPRIRRRIKSEEAAAAPGELR